MIEGIYTHFATNDKNVKIIEKQHKKFEKIIRNIKNEKILIHCCSSYGALKCGNFLHDMVRVGFALYTACEYDANLKNVVSIKSKIVHTNHISKGDFVGYDCLFVADKNMKIGIVPFGYGDGLPRRISGVGSVLINGQYAEILGYVCMDTVVVDITNIDGVDVGDEVVILGRVGMSELSVFSYAKILNTSPYEILTNFKRSRLEVVVE